MGKYNPKHDRKNYDRERERERERKSFNPLFAVRVSAGLKNMRVPPETLKEMKINPDYVKQNKRGDTIIPMKVSGETGLVLNPGVRPNYWLLASKEFRRGRFAQVVAGEEGQKLRGGLGRDGEVYFSVGQTRPLYLIQAHEGKDYIVVRRYKLLKNEEGDQNYLDMAQIFQNEFANTFHLTMPTKLLETVKGHLPEEIKFLAEAVTAALEKVHADEDYPAYAEIREPKQEPEQESEEEIPEESQKMEESKSKKEETIKKPKDEADLEAVKGKKQKMAKIQEEEAEQEIQESTAKEDDEKIILSKSDIDKMELKRIHDEFAQGAKNTVLADALEGLKKKEVKKPTTRKKSTTKK